MSVNVKAIHPFGILGIYKGPEDAFVGLKPVKTIEPNKKLASAYGEAYKRWEDILKRQ